MPELGSVIKPGRAKIDKYTPQRGTEFDPGNVQKYVPVKDESGKVVYNSPFTGGNSPRGKGGGGGRNVGPTRADFEEEQKRKAAEAKLKAQQEAAEAAAKLKAQQEAAAKAMADRLADIQAKRAAADISVSKQDIIKRGGTTSTRTAGAGKLKITETKDKGGRRVREVRDIKTGETRITEYGVARGGGSSRAQRGVVGIGNILGGEVVEETKPEVYGPVQPTEEERQGYAMMNVPSPDRTNQTYSQQSGMFLEAPYGLGAGGTAIATPPTPSEKAKIEKAEYAGSFERGVKDIKTGLKWYEEKVVRPLSKSKAFKTYEKKVVKPLSLLAVQPATSKVKKGISLYKEKVVKPLRRQFPSLGETPLGQIAQAKRIIQTKKTGETVRIGLPGQVRNVKVDKFQNMGLVEFGKEVYLGEVETAFTDIGKKSKIEDPALYGKGIRLVSEFGAYAVPGYFGGEVGLMAGEAAAGGKFGGPSNILEFAKEKPLEVVLVGGLGVLKGAKFIKGIGAKAAKQAKDYQKYQKYLREPKSKVVNLERQFDTATGRAKVMGTETKLRISGERDLLKFRGKAKGEVSVTQPKPTETFKGTVKETIKGDTGTGSVKLIKGKYTETVTFEKTGIKRITKVGKDGSGTVEIYKNGKLVGEFELAKGVSPSIKYKEAIKKSIGQKELGTPGQIEIIRTPKTDILKLKELPKRDLSTGLLRTEEKGALQFGREGKVTQRVLTKEKVLDITKAGPQTDILSLRRGGESITKKKITGKKISVAEGGEAELGRVDLTGFSDVGGTKKLIKRITPNVDRAIIQTAEQRIVTTFGDVAKKGKVFVKDFKPLKVKTTEPTPTITKRVKEAGGQTQKLIQKTKEKAQEVLFIEPSKKFLKVVSFETPRIPIVSKVIKPKVQRLSGRFGLGLTSAVAVKTAQQEAQILAQEPAFTFSVDESTAQLQDQPFVSIQAQPKASASAQASATTQIPATGQKPAQDLFTRQIQRPTRPKQPKQTKPFPKLFKDNLKPKTPVKDLMKKAGYIAQIKEGGKWKNIDDESYIKRDAIALSLKAADESLSASTRIKPTNKSPALKALNILNTASRMQKFRDYRIVGGKKVKLPEGSFIEKKGKRLDTKNERQNIQAWKRRNKGLLSGSSGGMFGVSGNSLGGFGNSRVRKKSTRKSKGFNWFN